MVASPARRQTASIAAAFLAVSIAGAGVLVAQVRAIAPREPAQIVVVGGGIEVAGR